MFLLRNCLVGFPVLHLILSQEAKLSIAQTLIADGSIPTTQDAENKPRPGPRIVRNAAFTWIKPEQTPDYELLAVSPAAFDSVGLKRGEEATEEFKALVSG